MTSGEGRGSSLRGRVPALGVGASLVVAAAALAARGAWLALAAGALGALGAWALRELSGPSPWSSSAAGEARACANLDGIDAVVPSRASGEGAIEPALDEIAVPEEGERGDVDVQGDVGAPDSAGAADSGGLDSDAPDEVRAASEAMEPVVPDLHGLGDVVEAILGELHDDCTQTQSLVGDAFHSLDQGFRDLESLCDALRRAAIDCRDTLRDDEGRNRISAFAGEAEHLLDELLEVILGLSRNSMLIIRRLLSIGGRMEEVDSILADAKRIASRTRILSINASIEASQAGPYGRSFALVAAEVKSLAVESSGFNERIDELLSGMKDDVGLLYGLAETIASRDMSGTIEREQRVEEMMAHVGESERVLNEGTERIQAQSDGIEKAVSTVVRALQVDDMVQQVADKQKRAVADIRELMSLMQTGDAEALQASVAALQDRVAARGRSVTQQDMGEGDVELF